MAGPPIPGIYDRSVPAATQMWLVANPDHSVILNTGNCVDLPDVYAVCAVGAGAMCSIALPCLKSREITCHAACLPALSGLRPV
jgi:hypothetical protein